MKYITEGLFPTLVFKNFECISRIPRPSGHEGAISDYIMNFAKSLGLETYQDSYKNLIVKKPATNGSPDPSTVMLQAHMDMVPEASDFVDHDFTKDPIELILEGNNLRANQTTLGADDGIGVAYMMAILESEDLSHPNLECVFTVDEEVGLIGVEKLDMSDLKSTYILNLDGEEDDSILVGCAGAVNASMVLRKEYKPAISTNLALEINVKGLFGGHSGMDIDKQRANANVIMGRILSSITYDYDLFYIGGGSKRNAIPRSCEAVLSIKNEDLEALVREIQKLSAKIQKEYYPTDPNLKIELRRSAPTDFKVFTDNCKNKIVDILSLTPDGIISRAIDLDMVDTSSNFAVISEGNQNIEFNSLVRFSADSKKDYVKTKLARLAKLVGAQLEFSAEYPAWEHDKNSKLEDLSVDVYKEVFDKDPNVVIMHCGIECGILLNKLRHKAEAISIGPNMFNVHTPQEHVEVDSVARMWKFIIRLLEVL